MHKFHHEILRGREAGKCERTTGNAHQVHAGSNDLDRVLRGNSSGVRGVGGGLGDDDLQVGSQLGEVGRAVDLGGSGLVAVRQQVHAGHRGHASRMPHELQVGEVVSVEVLVARHVVVPQRHLTNGVQTRSVVQRVRRVVAVVVVGHGILVQGREQQVAHGVAEVEREASVTHGHLLAREALHLLDDGVDGRGLVHGALVILNQHVLRPHVGSGERQSVGAQHSHDVGQVDVGGVDVLPVGGIRGRVGSLVLLNADKLGEAADELELQSHSVLLQAAQRQRVAGNGVLLLAIPQLVQRHLDLDGGQMVSPVDSLVGVSNHAHVCVVDVVVEVGLGQLVHAHAVQLHDGNVVHAESAGVHSVVALVGAERNAVLVLQVGQHGDIRGSVEEPSVLSEIGRLGIGVSHRAGLSSSLHRHSNPREVGDRVDLLGMERRHLGTIIDGAIQVGKRGKV